MTRFVLVDAVGVTEHEFVEPPLNREKGLALKKLLEKAAALTLTEDEAATLASRLAKLELELSPEERAELDDVAGTPVKEIVRGLVDAVDTDVQAEVAAAAEAAGQDPTVAIQDLIERAVEPVAANPELRSRILELRASHDRIIDEVNTDTLVDAHGVVDPGRAKDVVEDWSKYLEEHRDEIAAIQIATDARDRRLRFADIQELADRIARPPHNWTPDLIWDAYLQIDTDRVRKSDRHTLTDLVSLLRFTLGIEDELVPYAEIVRERYAGWLTQQEQAGTVFTESERWWLDRMVDVIAASAGISVDDLDMSPFDERGGVDGIVRDLGDRAESLIAELNDELTA